MIVTPLYGHDSEKTAYVVLDYPYGSWLRCQVRYWLEVSEQRGWRFVRQTSNPKKSALTWNAPKKSTYVDFAAAMYLDEKGHVQWTGIHRYSEPQAIREFIDTFPKANLRRLVAFILVSAAHAKAYAEGTTYMTVNGDRVVRTDADKERHQKSYAEWKELAEYVKTAVHLTEQLQGVHIS